MVNWRGTVPSRLHMSDPSQVSGPVVEQMAASLERVVTSGHAVKQSVSPVVIV